MKLREDAMQIVRTAIRQVQPHEAVRRALSVMPETKGRLVLVAAGKAAWDCLEREPESGIVITKYGHSEGAIGTLEILEAGHPVPDENSFTATQRALTLTESLTAEGTEKAAEIRILPFPPPRVLPDLLIPPYFPSAPTVPTALRTPPEASSREKRKRGWRRRAFPSSRHCKATTPIMPCKPAAD